MNSSPARQRWAAAVSRHRIIAVIRAAQPDVAYQMAHTAAAAGLRLIEITWNTPEATALIQSLTQAWPDCLVGTGTVLTEQDLRQAQASGAAFVFTPHVDSDLLALSQALAVPLIPGALTPTEIVRAWQAGAAGVKVFPVSAVGGWAYLESLRGPLGQIPLIPTGGVTLANTQAFLQAGAWGVGLAGDLFPKEEVTAGRWAALQERLRVWLATLAPFCIPEPVLSIQGR
ncbi:MAG: bifunctional 4-hydroxy-2-oxoglutarate aldolase/2-dehydro-3-deoxy-phosphogluconate aldolase [Gloeomargaritaceae cyanobacterium C42_A2020_066]|nr:bifunctional 4-hydroxy-2-oxoglutarate aldolase/2-dehydro-3-deoxy-phosphogluconate aldolase [Gloeomargaritaceae cyanobacterium C42_A2020_066]